MATLKQIRDKANPILANFWKDLQIKQAEYHAKHGKYFQLLVTPETEVVDGRDSNFAKRNPSDEKFSKDVTFGFLGKLPFQIRVDEGVGRDKQNYSAVATIKLLNDKVYKRELTSEGGDSGWYEYIER